MRAMLEKKLLIFQARRFLGRAPEAFVHSDRSLRVLGGGVSLQGSSNKAQPLLLTWTTGISAPPPVPTLNVE